MATHTIYIHPGENFCNVYAMDYPMRPGQEPRNLDQKYKDKWVRIGQLNQSLQLRFLDPAYARFKEDIENQMGGTFFEVQFDEQ